MGFIEYIQRSSRALVSVCMYMCVYSFKPFVRYTYNFHIHKRVRRSFHINAKKQFSRIKSHFLFLLWRETYTRRVNNRVRYTHLSIVETEHFFLSSYHRFTFKPLDRYIYICNVTILFVQVCAIMFAFLSISFITHKNIDQFTHVHSLHYIDIRL